MYWLLFGCCVLIFFNCSVASQTNIKIFQKPRFHGTLINGHVDIYCVVQNQSSTVKWYKIPKYDSDRKNRTPLKESKNKVLFRNSTEKSNTSITLTQLTIDDSGVYFCSVDGVWGPGTEIQVFQRIDFDAAEKRSNYKDFLIFIQALLLTLLAIVPLLHHQKLLTKEDAIYEEPEQDHIYEGLQIEHCGDLYEDISMYAQPEPAQGSAPWKQE
ncbi:hypothetical protein UPYG_G00141490 [Umbra pygmaea]|uniref:Ig-like domain-containing protein n=1 Tax=Umbra pygmaea TaxID=75934 RepID=A0ABD0WWT1_UMBPY